MDKRLQDVLAGQEANYMMPFFWIRDGHHGQLADMIQQVYDSGARAFCVESRTHEKFCQQEWWDDMDLILAEASRRNMKVWLLDDKHFPTGYANGLITEKYPQLRKWHLVEHHLDVIGPAPQSMMLLEPTNEEHRLLGVYAYRRHEEAETLDAQPIDLTDYIADNAVYWDIPKGVYRIFALYQSRKVNIHPDYIHMIDPQSVRVQLEAVYQPHWEHYQRYFGNTFAGFFSDEPCLGNGRWENGTKMATVYYNQQLGQPGLALPWTDEVLSRMKKTVGPDVMAYLPGLWYQLGNGVPEVRVAYMDTITQLWKEAFSYQLGDWCRAHGVQYIGHIIEDMDTHMRLTSSGGHYFRSLDGQDMAGIDVVLHQIVPGMAHYTHAATVSGGFAESSFYDYLLARLAASLSHIQPRMQGRAMCEVFGAYGWAEGVPMMKHLLDHMLVRGINHFVPHAFSLDFPDDDCPPHFNGGGENPEFEAFAKLMKYGNQTAHLLCGATEVVSAAILYMAEAEWSGKKCQSMREPARVLYDAQMNYDLLPIDALMTQAHVENGQLAVEKMRYPVLIIPQAEYLPQPFVYRLMELEAQGLMVLFLHDRPAGVTLGRVVTLDSLPQELASLGAADVTLQKPFPLLRVYHTRREHSDLFMFVNESMQEDFHGTVYLPIKGNATKLDLLLDMKNTISVPDGQLLLHLACGQSTLLVFDGVNKLTSGAKDGTEFVYEPLPMQSAWTLSTRKAHSSKDNMQPHQIDALKSVTGCDGLRGFSGWMHYEATFTNFREAMGLDLGLVGECANVWLDGQALGLRIAQPYCYQVVIPAGTHCLTVEVSNSLVHEQPDKFSRYLQIPPSGLLGPIRLMYIKE